MKALVFRHNLAREAASASGGRVDRRAFASRFAPVRIEDISELPLPAADWVRVETTFSGLCGSDVKQILLNGVARRALRRACFAFAVIALLRHLTPWRPRSGCS